MKNSNFILSNKSSVMVNFIISSNNLDLDIIIDKLSIRGDNIEIISNSSNSICILSAGYKESYDVNIQLDCMINNLIKKKEILYKLYKHYNLTYKFEVTINIKNNIIPGIFLSSYELEFANYIGAEFIFCI